MAFCEAGKKERVQQVELTGMKMAGSSKRFGARYGRKIRARIEKIESELKKKHLCPSCQKQRVKRIAKGIWGCRKCGATFAAKAYKIGE